VPPEGFLGNAPRNSLRGPGLVNFDLALAKDTAMPALGSNGRVEFRAEIFNILNRANFASEMIDEGGWSPDSELAGAVGTKVDIVPYRNVAGSAAELVKLVDVRLFGGGMPLGLRDEIYQAVTAVEAMTTQ
jgi:hypothetical protein